MFIKGGTALQGYSVGIMKMANRRYPLPPGDVANPTSYPFPVLVREIPGGTNNPAPPIWQPDGRPTPLLAACIDAAQALEADGVHAIAMCCGFFALIQPVMAQSVGIPILTSPLIMLPVIQQLLGPDRSVIVVTASRELLTHEYFSAVGADLHDRIVVVGLDDSPTFNDICMGGTAITLETDNLRDEVVERVVRAREQHPQVAAIMLECSSLPPFAADIAQHAGLPVFDFIACVEWLHRAMIPKRYTGYC